MDGSGIALTTTADNKRRLSPSRRVFRRMLPPRVKKRGGSRHHAHEQRVKQNENVGFLATVMNEYGTSILPVRYQVGTSTGEFIKTTTVQIFPISKVPRVSCVVFSARGRSSGHFNAPCEKRVDCLLEHVRVLLHLLFLVSHIRTDVIDA